MYHENSFNSYGYKSCAHADRHGLPVVRSFYEFRAQDTITLPYIIILCNHGWDCQSN